VVPYSQTVFVGHGTRNLMVLFTLVPVFGKDENQSKNISLKLSIVTYIVSLKCNVYYFRGFKISSG
jgi:hypothetical protein